MSINPTHYCREDAKRDAMEMFGINEEQWSELNMIDRLWKMLDAAIVVVNRKIIAR